MTDSERQKARVLLAEKVMKWNITPALPPVGRYSVDDLAVAWRRGQFAKWYPFSNPATAIELIEALPGGHEGIGIEIHYERETHCWAAWMRWSGGKESPAEICETFAEAVSMAVYRLVVERPELFAELPEVRP